MNKIIVVGGGASGLMAAIMAARAGAKVTVLEHNGRVGRKICATGNGRCNLTNSRQESACYGGEDPSFAWRVISRFPAGETLRFFGELGIGTRDRGGWIYPQNDQASAVADVLSMEAEYRRVTVKTREDVTRIEPTAEGFLVHTASWRYPCDRVILCAGSPASQVEGSCGAGYRLAEALGHTIVRPLAALTPLRLSGNSFGRWAGCRAAGSVSLLAGEKKLGREQGEILFTSGGISGIAVFQLSRLAARPLARGEKLSVRLDLFPKETHETLAALLDKRRADCPYKNMQKLMIGLVPEKLIPIFARPDSDAETTAMRLKDLRFAVAGTAGEKQAQICVGGVDTRELTPDMESRLHPGLYFAGEVVDVDGPCGGYNLQWAWSSGAVAGCAAAGKPLSSPLREKESK